MNLQEFFNIDLEIDYIAYDSRKVKENTLFFCLPGNINDGHMYAQDAIKNGAIAVVCNHAIENLGVHQFIVDNVEEMLSKISAKFYNNPSHKLKCIGVTGTDGKTTISIILSEFLNKYSKCGYIGTNGIMYNNKEVYLGCTTPFPLELHYYLNEMVNENVTSLVMEVSSHGIAMKRVNDVKYDAIIISNITSDHIDFHGSIENYINTKLSAVELMKTDSILILNSDDLSYDKLKNSNNVVSYGINNYADFQAFDVQCYIDHIIYSLLYKEKVYEVKINMIGIFNVYNTLAVIAYLISIGYNINEVINFMHQLPLIPGRVNYIDEGQEFIVIIDFAHTENGVTQMLKYVRDVVNKSNNKVFSVIGTVGERDFDRRRSLSEITTTYSDFTIFTDENPRREDPKKILADMAKHAVNNNYMCINDRETAIMEIFKMAKKGDVVMLLAKGVEQGITYLDYTLDYNEETVARKCLKQLKK